MYKNVIVNVENEFRGGFNAIQTAPELKVNNDEYLGIIETKPLQSMKNLAAGINGTIGTHNIDTPLDSTVS